ncbi:MAG TPA: 6-carboxytetrahydropterin synthase QueD [Phycisphaerae bacterium]|nr:6-carboxytetrahydropterin synthase QueD [Phycisphaerae bacterium]HUT62039.1 6-carboxytetrahydropterin synthase QueD [Phycisphaerae bacterium]
MEAELIKTFRFEAAHSLRAAPEGHKCRRLHGHSYRVDVHVTGRTDPNTGWVMDFGQIAKAVEPIIAELDHRNLDDVPGLDNSTSEMLAKHIWDRIAPALPGLSAVAVWESDTSRVIYRG